MTGVIHGKGQRGRGDGTEVFSHQKQRLFPLIKKIEESTKMIRS